MGVPPKPPSTNRLDRFPTLLERAQAVLTAITPETRLVLQILPSGQVLTLDIPTALTIGRRSTRMDQTEYPDLDLAPLNARQHGVSRLHCRLERQESYFTVCDLGSTNGTYLNSQSIVPQTAYPITDGDLLVLGTLHILIHLMSLPSP